MSIKSIHVGISDSIGMHDCEFRIPKAYLELLLT